LAFALPVLFFGLFVGVVLRCRSSSMRPPPRLLNEHVVHRTPAAVHADAGPRRHHRDGCPGEWAALVGCRDPPLTAPLRSSYLNGDPSRAGTEPVSEGANRWRLAHIFVRCHIRSLLAGAIEIQQWCLMSTWPAAIPAQQSTWAPLYWAQAPHLGTRHRRHPQAACRFDGHLPRSGFERRASGS
jgi:hypothetical protein